MIKHLLIDLDGTLIDQNDSPYSRLKFMSKLLPRLKKNKGWGVAWKNMKEGAVALQTVHKDKTNFSRMSQIIQKNLEINQAEADQLFLEALNYAYPSLKKYFRPLEGAAPFIEWAKDHYTLILATNPVWPLELVKERMKWGEINPNHFKSITTFDRMHTCKPDPEYFREILAQEKLEPSECMMIGNEEKMDVPATKAGIPVFLVNQKLKRSRILVAATAKNPGAWTGNFSHIKIFLEELSVTKI